VKLIKNQGFANGTALLGGRWNVGEGGLRVFLALKALAAIGFVVAGVTLLAGWVEGAVWVFVGAGLFSVLLDVLMWSLSFPELVITGLIIAVFVITVVLGVMWLEPRVASWFL
jgi:hypothetical protein